MQDNDEPIRIKLRGFGNENAPARRWVAKQYSTHPVNPLNSKQLVFDHGNAVTLVELTAYPEDPETAVIKWIQSTPQQTGAATKTIKQLQQDAAESDISLKLDIFQTGSVDPNRLEQIYAAMGFEKDDDDSMIWHPYFTEAWSKSYKKSINCSNPKGFSQRAHCAARRKRQAGGKTKSKSVNESWQSAAQALEDYANQNISHEHPAFGDFMYHAELIRKGHQDIHREDLPKVAADYKDKLIDIVNTHTAMTESAMIIETITAYHGSGKADIRSKRFWPLTHFGTEKAARDRMDMVGFNNPNEYRIYQVELDIKNPAMIKDEDVQHSPTQFAFALNKAKIFSKLEMMSVTVWPTIKGTSNEAYDAAYAESKKYSRETQRRVETKQLIKLLKSKGYDGIVYKNKHEDKGSLSYVILDPSQARIVRSRRIDEDWTLEEATSRGDFSTVFRNRSNEEGGHRHSITADEFVEHIDNQLSLGYHSDQAVVELAMLYERHPHKIKNWPELVAVLDKHKAELIKIITYHYTKELHHHAMTRSAIVSAALIAAGATWPELKSMLEQNKAKVIKGLLTLVKEDADDFAIKQIRALRDAHVNWPELNIIHKSIAIGKEPLNESKLPALDALLPTIDPHIARSIKLDVDKMRTSMERIGHRPIVQFLSDISVYALTIGKAKLVEVVEATKPLMLGYIEHILSMYNQAFANHSESEPLYWILKSIARLKRRVGVTWPELDSLLETYKAGIVKTCLKQAKMANAYSIEDLEGLLEQLSDIGVDWPELAIIKKSLSTGINESREVTAADLGDATNPELRTAARLATQLVQKMQMGYTFAITNSLGDMRAYMLDNNTQRLILNAVEPEIVEYITYLLNRSLEPNLPEQLVTNALSSAVHSVLLVKKIGMDTTELDRLIASKKAQIVRAILLALKTGNSDITVTTLDMMSILSSLENLGLDWPEIEIIRKSITSGRKRLRESDLDPIFKEIDAEQSKLTIIQQLGLARLRSTLRRGLLANGSMHAFMVHLNYLKLNDAQKATVYPQLDQDFAAFITRRLKKKEMRIVLNVFGGLVLNGIDCPNVTAVINKHKPAVLKELLNGIRTHYDQVSKLVVEIVDNKILDWPELEIIMKSIRSSQLKENDLLDKPTPTIEELAKKHNCTPQDVLIELRKGVAVEKEHTDRLEVAREIAMDHLNEDLYYYEKLAKVERVNEMIEYEDIIKYGVQPALHTIATLKMHEKSAGRNTAKLDQLLEKLRPRVIKRALEVLKLEDTSVALSIVQLAKEAGCNWPELETIVKSVAAINREKRRQRDE